MTSIDEHKKIAKSLIDDINEKIRSDLITERQNLVGFAASEASTNIFAIYLHKKNLISPGFNVNHKFFASEKIAYNNFEFDFPNKDSILKLLCKQELFRDKLCYGKHKEKEVVEEAIKNLFDLKREIESILGEQI